MDNCSIKVRKNDSNKVLFKHVATIHKVNSLSLLQNKINNVLYFHAYETIENQELHKISIGELCHYLSYKGHNYAEIKESLIGLIKLIVEWNVLNDSVLIKEDWTASTVLASASIKNGVIEYSYSYHMRKLLSDPKIYASINLMYQENFKSKYGLALYENSVRYINIKQTPWFNYALFRDLLGVSREKYPQYKDFKRRVLDPAIHEVNAYSDIRVEPVFKKIGRRISDIKFNISRRNKKNKILILPQSTPSDRNTQKYENLTADQLKRVDELKGVFQLSEYQALWVVKTYPEYFIKEKISFVRSYKGARNTGAILISALKNDYKNSVTIREFETVQLKKIQDEHNELKLENFIECINEMKFYVFEVRDMITRFENHLRIEYSEEYKNFCKNGLLKDHFSSQLCYRFCLEKFPNIFELIANLE